MINAKLKKNEKVVVGSIRQSQLITTFGVGSMVDFVDHTVIMSGIDNWHWADQDEYKIFNQNLQNLLGVQYFVKPKLSEKTTMWDKGSADIPASIFPTMLYCPQCKSLVSASSVTPKNNKFFCHSEGCPGNGKSQLVPSRFVLVCPNGHIEDFPYDWWVHKGPGENKFDCTLPKPKIKMYYTRNRTDLDSLVLKCECGAVRSMKNASGVNAFAEYHCTGKRPWLGDSEKCNAHEEHQYMQMRVRSESSVFFSSTVSALTIPPWSTKIAQEIQKVYAFLGPDADNKDIVIRKVKSKFPNVQEDVILDIYDKVQTGKDKKTSMREIIEDEYVAISSVLGNGSDDFISHVEAVPDSYDHIIENVVALDRLTVVTAMNGFKRLTAPAGYGDKTLSKITNNPHSYWLPGIELRGEGIFIQFNQEIIDTWVHKNGSRYNDMRNKLAETYLSGEIREGRFSPQYVFLHTFSHLFIRELSHLCGYSAASIKERIYSTYNGSKRKMAGILVYTSTADADGSLGGLVEQAKTINMEKIINSMVERGKWCSADPVCYTSMDQGNLSLNYAACFACTLLPETSCEFFNVLLDRCAVCGSPENAELGLMNWSK